MNEWTPTCFSSDKLDIDSISDEYKTPAKRMRALLRDKNAPITLYPEEHEACDMFSDLFQRTMIETLILCPDASDEEILSLLEIDIETLTLYKEVFFNIEKKLNKRIKLVSYIENGIQEARDSEDEAKESSYLFKKWALALGKEFIIWKFSLEQIDMSTASLYNTVVQEAFFYHKEKSLSQKDVSSSEYQRSVNSLLSGLKTRQDIAETDKEDAATGFMENLDIIIEEKPNTNFITSGDFINNVDVVSKEESENIFGTKELDE